MAKTVTQLVYNQANDLLNQGKISKAWQALANGGDNYAANAAHITNPSNSETLTSILARETL